ncbi:MAG: sugar phosphate isomerase/epimerase [Dehalococcoidia bacterium]|nr:sugar phosphate isomerase/epimerase [Dehalococcoidia bacterium]
MQIVSLSTMWGVGRFETFREFAEAARKMGFAYTELNHQFPAAWTSELGSVDGITVSSVHDPCPFATLPDGKPAGDLSLCSLDESERQEAIRFAKGSINFAQRVGGQATVLHMGDVGSYYEHERYLRRLYAEGKADSQEFIGGKEWLMKERVARQEAHLEVYAGERSIKLGLENRCYYYELPGIDEMGVLLKESDPQVVGYWHDTGHADILERLGYVPHQEWLKRYRDRLIGSHINDVHVITDHRAPGAGEVAWDMVASGFPQDGFRILEIDRSQDFDTMVRGIALLREKGVISA